MRSRKIKSPHSRGRGEIPTEEVNNDSKEENVEVRDKRDGNEEVNT